jgi:DNA-binding NarL/FixJ family response regulator
MIKILIVDDHPLVRKELDSYRGAGERGLAAG